MKCSITNSDVKFDQVLVEDEVQEALSSVEANRPLPIVQLNSGFLETDTLSLQTEPLSLLTERTYVDSLLTTLPVCCLENSTSATNLCF